MAQRRMINKSIAQSDAFLDMPVSSRELYFQLLLEADDDGFVNSPLKIMRTVGASKNDIELLIVKKFLLDMDDGIVVIKHWRIHNWIRQDRYKETLYQDKMERLEVTENGDYKRVLSNDIPSGNQMVPTGTRSIGKYSIGKYSIGKVNNTNAQNKVSSQFDVTKSFEMFWNTYNKKVAKPKALSAFKAKCKDEKTFTEIMQGLNKQAKAYKWNEDNQYQPYASTWLNQERWKDETYGKVDKYAKYFEDATMNDDEKREALKELEELRKTYGND